MPPSAGGGGAQGGVQKSSGRAIFDVAGRDQQTQRQPQPLQAFRFGRRMGESR